MPSPTYQLVNGSAKIQIEDLLGPQSTGGWVYQRPGQGNAGAEGAHYFYRSQTVQATHKVVPENGHFGFSVEIDQAGTYGILLRATRDTNGPPDARNDIWIQIDGDTQSVMAEGSPELVSGGDGFVKFKGAQTKWVNAHMFSAEAHGVPNAESDVVFGVGLHTIVFAPRSNGYHIDSLRIVQRSVLPEPEPDPSVVAQVETRAGDYETVEGAYDADLDLGRTQGADNAVGLRFRDMTLDPEAEIESAYFVFTASGDSAAGGSLTIQLQNYMSAKNFVSGADLNTRGYLGETVAWDDIGAWEAGKTYRSADISTLIETLIGDGGIDALDALVFRIAGTGTHSARSFEGGAATAPELVITYDALA
jgi:hypothetical protein